jgi:hypothetical protein
MPVFAMLPSAWQQYGARSHSDLKESIWKMTQCLMVVVGIVTRILAQQFVDITMGPNR